jgi:transglutaminase-like putative cysteine protease
MWAAGVLVVVAACGVAVRIAAIRRHRPAQGERAYLLSYEASFVPAKAGACLRVALPGNTPHCRIHRASYAQPALAMDVVRRRATGEREAVVLASNASTEAAFNATFELHVSKTSGPLPTPSKVVLSTAERAEYLRSQPNTQVRAAEIAKLLHRLSEDGPRPSQLLARIFDHVSAQIAEVRQGPSDAAGALRAGRGSALGKARAMVALCRAGRIPTRIVTGFILEEAEAAAPHTWVEAYLPKEWISYDPTAGYARHLPSNYLPVRRDGLAARAHDCRSHQVRFSIRRVRPASAMSIATTGRPTDVLHLSRLPLGMQETLAILLLLPVGALITAIFRNIVGLQTFGTFTPSLLALSFLYADWRTGLVMLVGILAIGLVGRSLLDRLRLLMVPRLSVVLAVVVLFTAFAVSALDYLALTPSARAVILPMVILTMLIERFHITAEEDGLPPAAKRLGLTALVAGCCLGVLRWKQLGQLALAFPEGELLIISALLLIGRYSGYRLVELVRFRDVTEATTPIS